MLSLVRSHDTADGCCKHCGKRPASADDPLAPLTTAILATRATGQAEMHLRPDPRRTMELAYRRSGYKMTIAPSNLPKTDTCPGS